MLPLYSQGYSLARYLIERGGRHKYVAFVGDGLAADDWSAALARHYGVANVAQMQYVWLDWVKQGCPAPPAALGRRRAAAGRLVGGHDPRPESRSASVRSGTGAGGRGTGRHERRPHVDLCPGPPAAPRRRRRTGSRIHGGRIAAAAVPPPAISPASRPSRAV